MLVQRSPVEMRKSARESHLAHGLRVANIVTTGRICVVQIGSPQQLLLWESTIANCIIHTINMLLTSTFHTSVAEKIDIFNGLKGEPCG
jgi:hypothetical protein